MLKLHLNIGQPFATGGITALAFPVSWSKLSLRLYSAWIDSCGYVVIPLSYLKRIRKN